MLPDFATTFSDFIKDDGTVFPSVAFAPIGELNWQLDPDGLIMTATVTSFVDDQPCLLTALFPMSHGEATTKHRQGRFPASHADGVTVTRKLDEVQGRSGEKYSRFAVKVFPLPGESK